MIGDEKWEKFQNDKGSAIAVRAVGGALVGGAVGAWSGPKIEDAIGYHEDIWKGMDVSDLTMLVTTLIGMALGGWLALKKGKRMYQDHYGG